jgi:negative regulator of flagellin synthesis FlgM
MKITDQAQFVNQVIKSGNVQPVKEEEASSVAKPIAANDRVDVSSDAVALKSVLKAVEAMNNTPEVDQDKVSAIKKAIAEGTYELDANKIAEGMLKEASFFSEI